MRNLPSCWRVYARAAFVTALCSLDCIALTFALTESGRRTDDGRAEWCPAQIVLGREPFAAGVQLRSGIPEISK